MSAIFETEMRDLEYPDKGESRKAKASTVKLVLLALADHANDYGESSYPAYDRLEIKTALSRQGLADTFKALQHNGFLTIAVRQSKKRTNNYIINIRAFPLMEREASELPSVVKPLDYVESSHLTKRSQATGLESSYNHPQPSVKISPKTSAPKRSTKTNEPIPSEIVLFREVVGRYPSRELYAAVTQAIQKVSSRLQHAACADDLHSFREEWVARAYNPQSIKWLDWAVTGSIPEQGSKKQGAMQAQDKRTITRNLFADAVIRASEKEE